MGPNGRLSTDALDLVAPLTEGARRLLMDRLDDGRLTGRGLERVRRVSRTIGDLRDTGPVIDTAIVTTALALRGDPLSTGKAAA